MRIRHSLWPAILVLLAFMHYADAPPVSGFLRVNPKSSSVRLPARLQLLLTVNGRSVAKTFPDADGKFLLNVPESKDSLLDFFCVAPGLDTMFLQSVPVSARSGTMQLLFPCEPDTTGSGDIICPKCRKEDQVYPMVYGDPIVITRHYDTTGKVSYERLPKNDVPTDSVVRAARYYCRRDKITF